MRAAKYKPIFKAFFKFRGDHHIQGFENYFEAVEWYCIHLESIGAKREKFARAKVERGGAIVWEMPVRPQKERPLPPADFVIQ